MFNLKITTDAQAAQRSSNRVRIRITRLIWMPILTVMLMLLFLTQNGLAVDSPAQDGATNGNVDGTDDLFIGELTDISLTPDDPKISATTSLTVKFINQNSIGQTGQIVVQFPESLTLPEVGTTMVIEPVEGSISATTAEVQEGNRI